MESFAPEEMVPSNGQGEVKVIGSMAARENIDMTGDFDPNIVISASQHKKC